MTFTPKTYAICAALVLAVFGGVFELGRKTATPPAITQTKTLDQAASAHTEEAKAADTHQVEDKTEELNQVKAELAQLKTHQVIKKFDCGSGKLSEEDDTDTSSDTSSTASTDAKKDDKKAADTHEADKTLADTTTKTHEAESLVEGPVAGPSWGLGVYTPQLTLNPAPYVDWRAYSAVVERRVVGPVWLGFQTDAHFNAKLGVGVKW